MELACAAEAGPSQTVGQTQWGKCSEASYVWRKSRRKCLPSQGFWGTLLATVNIKIISLKFCILSQGWIAIKGQFGSHTEGLDWLEHNWQWNDGVLVFFSSLISNVNESSLILRKCSPHSASPHGIEYCSSWDIFSCIWQASGSVKKSQLSGYLHQDKQCWWCGVKSCVFLRNRNNWNNLFISNYGISWNILLNNLNSPAYSRNMGSTYWDFYGKAVLPPLIQPIHRPLASISWLQACSIPPPVPAPMP